MARLGVNVDHAATLRQARYRNKSNFSEPNPVTIALKCLKAGADSIVMHLREDRRHIQDSDILELRNKLKNKKFNLEMSLAAEIVSLARKVKPDEVTLVPEKRQELTTEGGLNVIRYFGKIEKCIRALKAKNIKISLFIDPKERQIRAAEKVGADFIELHTGQYANATSKEKITKELNSLKRAARLAKSLSLGVNAGHGLNYNNVKAVAKIKEIEEFNIGHSIISYALETGINNAVEEMVRLIK